MPIKIKTSVELDTDLTALKEAATARRRNLSAFIRDRVEERRRLEKHNIIDEVRSASLAVCIKAIDHGKTARRVNDILLADTQWLLSRTERRGFYHIPIDRVKSEYLRLHDEFKQLSLPY